jgi:DNA-directed RNA polymerase subunit RPC12/RpoP
VVAAFSTSGVAVYQSEGVPLVQQQGRGAKPQIACERCQTVTIVKAMTVTYETTIETDTRETVHRHASTTFAVRCPECNHSFYVTRPA